MTSVLFEVSYYASHHAEEIEFQKSATLVVARHAWSICDVTIIIIRSVPWRHHLHHHQQVSAVTSSSSSSLSGQCRDVTIFIIIIRSMPWRHHLPHIQQVSAVMSSSSSSSSGQCCDVICIPKCIVLSTIATSAWLCIVGALCTLLFVAAGWIRYSLCVWYCGRAWYRAVVCGTMRSCMTMRSCVVLSGCVWYWAAVYGTVRLCFTQRSYVTLCDHVRHCVVVCDTVRLCVTLSYYGMVAFNWFPYYNFVTFVSSLLSSQWRHIAASLWITQV